MKKLLCMLLVMAAFVAMTACGKTDTVTPTDTAAQTAAPAKLPDPTDPELNGTELMEKALQVNSADMLLKSFDNVLGNFVDFNEDGTVAMTRQMYLLPGVLTDIFPHPDSEPDVARIDLNNQRTSAYSAESNMIYIEILGSGISFEDYTPYYQYACITYGENEVVESATVEDGKLIITTTYDLQSAIDEQLFTWENVDPQAVSVTRHVLDAETLVLESISGVVRYPDGSEKPFAECTYSFNVPQPELPEEYVSAIENEETITYTVVFDPDTDEEFTVTAELPANTYPNIVCDRDLYPYIYTDRECTTLYEYGGDETTLYLAKGK